MTTSPVQTSPPDYSAFFGTGPKGNPLEQAPARQGIPPFCDERLSKDELPFIEADVVKRQDGNGASRICESNGQISMNQPVIPSSPGLVIDGVVYDCKAALV